MQASINTGIRTASRLVDDMLEQIRVEINEAYQQSVTSNLYYAEGLERALEIIDKHTKGDNG